MFLGRKKKKKVKILQNKLRKQLKYKKNKLSKCFSSLLCSEYCSDQHVMRNACVTNLKCNDTSRMYDFSCILFLFPFPYR